MLFNLKASIAVRKWQWRHFSKSFGCLRILGGLSPCNIVFAAV